MSRKFFPFVQYAGNIVKGRKNKTKHLSKSPFSVDKSEKMG